MALPVHSITWPVVVVGRSNGELPASILVDTPGQAGGPIVRLVAPAARAWRALSGTALAAGHVLKATSLSDSYRTLSVQEVIFCQRYTTTFLPDRPYRTWEGQRWYQKPGTAVAAVPGMSNHGWGVAVDVGEERDGDVGTESIDAATLAWLVANESRFGWSHEVQSEPWHIRYWSGDTTPPAVLAFEKEPDVLLTDKLASGMTVGGALDTLLVRTNYLTNVLGLAGRLDAILAAAQDDGNVTVVADPTVVTELQAIRDALAAVPTAEETAQAVVDEEATRLVD